MPKHNPLRKQLCRYSKNHMKLSIPNINKKVRQWKKQRDKRPKTLTFHYGEQDQVDILSYAGLQEQASYLIIDEQYVRTLFISGYPYTASTGWLNMLINFNHNVDISYHIDQIDALQALPQLNRKITELESTRRAMLRSGKIIGSEL